MYLSVNILKQQDKKCGQCHAKGSQCHCVAINGYYY